MNLQEKNQLKRIIQKEVRRSLQEQKMLEEGIIDMITSAFSSLGGGAVDAAQEQLATTLLRYLGISPNGILAQAFIVGIGNLESGDIAAVLSGGQEGCQRVALRIIETMEITLIRRTMETWGLSATGVLGTSTQRGLENTLREFLSTNLNQTLSTAICNLVSGGGLASVTDMLPDSVKNIIQGGEATSSPAAPDVKTENIRRIVKKTLKENKKNISKRIK
jgi:hypothetical protein